MSKPRIKPKTLDAFRRGLPLNPATFELDLSFPFFGGYQLIEMKVPIRKLSRLFKEAEEKGISRYISHETIYRILDQKRGPEPEEPKRTVPPQYWLNADNHNRLAVALSELEEAEKLMKRVQEYFDRSICIDLMELRVRQQIAGQSMESFQSALRQQVESGQKEQSFMEKMLGDASGKLRNAMVDLQVVMQSTSRP